MTNKPVLTDEQIVRILEENRPEYDSLDKAIAVSRAIEQAILQSPELQTLRNDAERYCYLKKGNQWIVAATQTGFHVDGRDLDDLIDSEMEQKK